MFDSWRRLNGMETLKGAAMRIVGELQVMWCVVCYVIVTLIRLVLFQIPPLRTRFLADLEQRAQMQSYTGNWKVRPPNRSQSVIRAHNALP